MNEKDLKITLLHENFEFLEPCAQLLNKQWKRSLSARKQSLRNSFKDLPDSLLLIKRNEEEILLIGHSRLTRVLEDVDGCWIGSVVIDEKFRGNGYGKYLMKKTEEYAKQLNFTQVYLNTQDQQGFYEHLGYVYGEAVSSINFKSHVLMKPEVPRPMLNDEKLCVVNSPVIEGCINVMAALSDIPSPPPPPPITNVNSFTSHLGRYWMKKTL